jgi:hypothetical protein
MEVYGVSRALEIVNPRGCKFGDYEVDYLRSA